MVFLFALLGTTSEQFSNFLKKHLLTTKLLMAVIFFALGSALLYSQVPQEPPKGVVSQAGLAIPEAPSDINAPDALSWDFGAIKEGDIVKHVFIFKNKTRKALNIKDVTTSCGCAVSKVEKRSLKPGEETAVEVQFNSKGYSSEVKQYVYAHTDDLDNPIIRFIIKASVIKQ
jgi:hypothetical protein